MRIFAPFVQTLLDYAAYQDLDVIALRSRLEDQSIDITSDQETVAHENYLHIFEGLLEDVKIDHLGLHIGQYLNIQSLGLALEISLNTSSVTQGVSILQGFLQSRFAIVSAEVVEDGEYFVIQLESSIEDPIVRRNILEMVLCIIYRELKLMLPQMYPMRVGLPGQDTLVYQEVFDTVEVRTEYQLLLPKDVTRLEVNQGRIKEIEVLLPKFVSMLGEQPNSSDVFSRKMRSMILHMCAPEIPSFQQVKGQFHYSDRTIQRMLASEGTSFRKIVNSIKEELASYLSSEKHLKTKDIAYILGYSDASAYLHAVKSWKTK